MKALLVFAMLSGCQLVYPLEADDQPGDQLVQVRETFTRTEPAMTQSLTFDGEPSIEAGDLVVVMIQGRTIDDLIMTNMSPGWGLIEDEEALMCPGQFHVWYLAGINDADAPLTYDFQFSMADTFSVIVTAYAGANTARLMHFIRRGLLDDSLTETAFPAAEIAARSRVWFGGAALTAWSDADAPLTTEKLSSLQQLASYDLPAPSGAVPEVTLPLSPRTSFCGNIVQVAIEP
jgi:hypothetical protein